MNRNNVVIGVIGIDIHNVGLRVIDYFLTRAGFKVTNLGVMLSQEEFIKAALETDAGAILISSLYGHAEIDCQGFRDKCREAGIGNILLYIGGNVFVGRCEDWKEVEAKFKQIGFDRVYSPGCLPSRFINDLKADLQFEGNLERGNQWTLKTRD
jgi:methylaspartate mutase sigma subunit